MRIALFSDTYEPDVNGVARTLGRLVRRAADRGHEIALVTPGPGPSEPAAHLHLRVPGIPLPFYPELRLARPPSRGERRALEDFRPDLVHVATESVLGWSGRAWALRRRVPLVSSFHTDFPAYLSSYGLGLLAGLAWPYLRAFHARSVLTFCPSRATRRQLEEAGFHPRLRIWSRGVDSEHFRPTRRNEEVRRRLAPGADAIVLYVGRLAWEKRLSVLVEAFPRMRLAYRGDLRLVVVGDGPARAELQAGLTDGAHFTGYLRGDELADAYAAGDVFVFPSDTETFGNVVTEALASGLPVVAPARGGVTETVRHRQNGMLVPPGDSWAFTRETLRILDSEALRLRLAAGARREALGRSWDLVMDRLLAQYDEAAGRTLATTTSLDVEYAG